jgi:hypothetical protein
MGLPSLLIWGGPVFCNTPDKVPWLSDVRSVCKPVNGSSANSQLAESFRDGSGRILPSFLASFGLARDQFERVATAGFSAFHGFNNLILDSDADLIDGTVCLDSCFSSPEKLVKKGYSKFAAMAAAGDKLMVMTASSGGGKGSGATIGPGVPDYSTGYECVWANAEAGAAAAGVSFEPFEVPAGVPVPERGSAQRAGHLYVLDYRDQYMHGDHINKFGVNVLSGFLPTFFAEGLSSTWSVAPVVGFLGGLVAGGLGTLLVLSLVKD